MEPRAVNIGTGLETSVVDLAGTIGRVAQRTPKLVHAPVRAGELDRSCLDAAKAGAQLAWTPTVKLAEGAGHLITWMQKESR